MADYGLWTRAKKRYILWFVNEHDYIFCLNEDCDNPNEQPHSVHHIYSRGRYPKHKELHNPLNLIMLCRKCHDKFHHGNKEESDEAKRLTKKWAKERGLKKLFRRER